MNKTRFSQARASRKSSTTSSAPRCRRGAARRRSRRASRRFPARSRNSCSPGPRSRRRTWPSSATSSRRRRRRLWPCSAARTEKWLLHALDAYDKQGLYPACAALKDLAGFKRRTDAAGEGVALDRSGARARAVPARPRRPQAALEPARTPGPTPKPFSCPSASPRIPRAAELPPVQGDRGASLGAGALWQFQCRAWPVLADYAVRERALAWLNLLEAIRLESHIRTRVFRASPPCSPRCARSFRRASPRAHARLSPADARSADSFRCCASSIRCRCPSRFPTWAACIRSARPRCASERIAKERRALYTRARAIAPVACRPSGRAGGRRARARGREFASKPWNSSCRSTARRWRRRRKSPS